MPFHPSVSEVTTEITRWVKTLILEYGDVFLAVVMVMAFILAGIQRLGKV